MRCFVRMIAIIGILVLPLTGTADEADCKVLQVGELLPQFCCLDDHGQIWESQDYIGQRVLVFYFYRSDFSFCCTRQAERYRDDVDHLECFGAQVIGISGDAVHTHSLFKTTHRLNFPLLSDAEGAVARQFGVPLRSGGKSVFKDPHGTEVTGDDGQIMTTPRAFTFERWTFIVGKDGRVLYRETTISPVKDSAEVLEFLRNLENN